MKVKLFRRKQELEKDIAEFEAFLSAALLPQMPRPEFVSDLGRQLRFQGLKIMPIKPLEKYRKSILMASGILGSAIMLVTSIRGIMALAGVISLIVQRNRNSLERSTVQAA